MSSPGGAEARELAAPARTAGIIAWSAFLSAAVATMLCFAFVDPEALAAGDPPAWWTTRMRVYTFGFFFFWLVGCVAAALSCFLARGADRPR